MRQRTHHLMKSTGVNSSKYDDWICIFCQNHNYSFRILCNRCHVQTKQDNAYMGMIYCQQLQAISERQEHARLEIKATLSDQDQDGGYFPNVLLLMINNDPWEEQPYKRDIIENENIKWINNLIEE